MSRHLQLARRAPETDPEPSPLGEDEVALRAKVREFPKRSRIEDGLEAGSEPGPSYEMAVRILCPFCGSGDSTAATPCCAQAFEFAQGAVVADASEPDGFTAALAAAHHPAVIVLDAAARVGTRGAWRLRDAAQPLVALLASALVGAVAAAVMQRHVAERADEPSVTARPFVSAPPTGPAVESAAAASAPAPAPQRADAGPVVGAAAAAPEASRPQEPGIVSAARDVASAVVDAPPAPPVAASTESVASAASSPAVDPLAPSVAPAPAPVQLVSLPQPPDPSKWRSLRRGMSRAAVRALLGDPKWTDHSRNIDFWLYEEDSIFGKGWVAFYDMDGPVSTWREP